MSMLWPDITEWPDITDWPGSSTPDPTAPVSVETLEGIEGVLHGSFARRVLVNVYHGTDRVLEDLAFESWSLSGDLGAAVPFSGDGVIVYESVSGESVTPEGTKGVLSPFRARVELVMEVTAGDFVERVSLGTFRVVKSGPARDYTAGGLVMGSRVPVSFLSLDEDVRRRGFRSPESPPSLLSCFDEIRRITGMPVDESVTDAVIPASTVWEPKQGGRLEAVHQLGRVLGGTALVNRAGAWTIIPDTLGEPTATLRLGLQGTVVDVADEIETDTVYNVVVGLFEDDQRRPIYAVATAPAGSALDPEGAYGENTRYYSSDFVKTKAQALTAVQSILDLSIGSQEYDVQIRCHVNPTVELGEVARLKGWTRELVGRVVKLSLSDSPYMDVTLRVARNL